jgi:hypothetical protein
MNLGFDLKVVPYMSHAEIEANGEYDQENQTDQNQELLGQRHNAILETGQCQKYFVSAEI